MESFNVGSFDSNNLKLFLICRLTQILLPQWNILCVHSVISAV